VNKASLKAVALTTLFFGFWGPLVGGLPYVWLLVTIPFAYAFGGVPALVGGLLYALWQQRGASGMAGPWVRAGRGALCGLAGCAFFAAIIGWRDGGVLMMTGVLALHGVPAGAILAAWRRSAPGEEEAAAQALAPAPG
jgi:hypothetical protein